MCRRCLESDKRGPAHQRRKRRQWLLDTYGNGTVTACIWCAVLVGNASAVGYLSVGGRRLKVVLMEVDRLEPGGSYARWNISPACADCNRARSNTEMEVPEGCRIGAGFSQRRLDPFTGLPVMWVGPQIISERADVVA